MFGFGIPQLSIIAVMVMLVFGVCRLPELGSSFGKAIRNFKKSASDEDCIEICPRKDA